MAVVDQVLGQVYVHGVRPYIRDEEAEQRGAGAQSQGQGRDRLQVLYFIIFISISYF